MWFGLSAIGQRSSTRSGKRRQATAGGDGIFWRLVRVNDTGESEVEYDEAASLKVAFDARLPLFWPSPPSKRWCCVRRSRRGLRRVKRRQVYLIAPSIPPV
jgi:hypothetical protein